MVKRRRAEPPRARTRFNTRYAQEAPGPEGVYKGWKLRIWRSERKGRSQDPQLLIKCGCCEQSVVIVYSAESLSINNVSAGLEEWRKVLGPLLEGKEPKP